MNVTRYKRLLARIALLIVPHRHNLGILARKYGSDKLVNGYCTPYQFHFAPFRRRRVSLLEIGIGGGKSPQKGGASLRMWRDFFPLGRIYGIDVYDKRCHQEDRITVFQGDQSDEVFLRKVASQTGPLDVVIDDGSHINEHVLRSFRVLFPNLKSGGIYAIEDLATSYWSRYGGDSRNLDSKATSIGSLKSLVDGLNYSKIPDYQPTDMNKQIVSLHFYHSLAFVYKGENEPRLSAIDREVLGVGKDDN